MGRQFRRAAVLVVVFTVGIAVGVGWERLGGPDKHPLSNADYARLYAADDAIGRICGVQGLGLTVTPTPAQRVALHRQVTSLVDVVVRNPHYRDLDALHGVDSDEPPVDWHGQLWADQMELANCGVAGDYAALAFAIEHGTRLDVAQGS